MLWPLMSPSANCDEVKPQASVDQFYAHGWGFGEENHRYLAPQQVEIGLENVNDLQLAWVYGFEGYVPRSFPVVSRDTVFISDGGSGLVALAKDSGCQRWRFQAAGQTGNAIVYGKFEDKHVLLVSTRSNGMHAVDAETGQQIWHTRFQTDLVPMQSGAPLVVDEMVYVPMSSMEIGLALSPLYECCKTSGGVVAVSLRDGSEVWYRRAIAEAATVQSTFWLFVDRYGPSGAPVWGSVTYDRMRNSILFGTGQGYSHPAAKTTDAIISVDAKTGDFRWIAQQTSGDAYNISCDILGNAHPNCPDPMGPDVDFGAPPVLSTTRAGRELVFAGQKSGHIHALDANSGELVWQQRLGRGGLLGGVHFGIAVHRGKNLVIVPLSDRYTDPRLDHLTPAPGIFALDMDTGEVVWKAIREPECPRDECWPGISAAITVTDELVIAGGLDGRLLAYNINDGSLVWSHDAVVAQLTAVNATSAIGGSYDAHGAMLAGDMMFVSSGYGSFMQKPGNALLAFKLKK